LAEAASESLQTGAKNALPLNLLGGSAKNAVVALAGLTAVGVRGHPIQPFRQDEQGPDRAGMVGLALAMFGEEFHSGRGVNANLF